jgi:hypothetical protein
MRKPIQKILLFIVVLYFLLAYKDVKKGFIDGYNEANKQSSKSLINNKKNGQYHDFFYPTIILKY